MGILSKSIGNLHDSPRNGQDVMKTIPWKIYKTEYDCTSEPFIKPKLSSTKLNRIMKTLGSKEKFLQQKQSITLDTFKNIIIDLATQLDRVTTKVSGQSQAFSVVDDLSLGECRVFIFRWSEELKCLRSKYRNDIGKISNIGRVRMSLEGLNNRRYQDQKLTEAQKDFQWFINVLLSLPKSSVCLDECSRTELLSLYRKWKKGQLISMLPIMDFIMKTLLEEKVHISSKGLVYKILTLASPYHQCDQTFSFQDSRENKTFTCQE